MTINWDLVYRISLNSVLGSMLGASAGMIGSYFSLKMDGIPVNWTLIGLAALYVAIAFGYHTWKGEL